jgi:hypothetical protein
MTTGNNLKYSCFLFTKQDKSVRNILQQHDTSTFFLLSPAGRIRMWDYVDGRWNATQAASMYEGPLTAALARAYLEHAAKSRAKWIVLEDNDPAGYKSKRALAAKEAAGIVIDDLPKRSPDLNVLDYSLWHSINVRMRMLIICDSTTAREFQTVYFVTSAGGLRK